MASSAVCTEPAAKRAERPATRTAAPVFRGQQPEGSSQPPVVNSDDYTMVDFLESGEPDLFAKAEALSGFLQDWKSKGTYSYHRTVTSACTDKTTIRDPQHGYEREMIVLASNNYLGLNTRPELARAVVDALSRYGTGLCGSRFLSGTYELVEELEAELAAFEGREAAMVFTSGYQANVGTLSALLRKHDLVLIDRLSHASIVDGCHLAGCRCRTFRHNDPESLEKLLKRAAGRYQGTLIVVDGVFSMEGDLAPLDEIAALAERYGARLMVDEAHGTGVVGPTGRGAVEHFGVHDRVDLVIGTFSKSLASTGGFLAGRRDVVDYVRHYGRSYMFSASPTPVTIAPVLTALRIMQTEPELREKLWRNIRYFHQGLKDAGFEVYPGVPESAILTVVIGADMTTRVLSKRIHEDGLFVSTVAYPAVPRNKGLFRFSLSATHTLTELDSALEILADAGQEFGII